MNRESRNKHTFTGKWAALCVMLAALAPALADASGKAAGHSIDIISFGARPGSRADTTPAVIAALGKIRTTHASRLFFPRGRYDFWPDQAMERYCFVSNNDEGLKRIAFLLDDIKKLEIDGDGAQFVFHGWITPFVLEHARAITLKGFSIDWGRTFDSEATVREVHDDGLTVEFAPAYPYDVRDGILVFTDGGTEHEPLTTVKGSEVLYPYGSLLEFDPRKGETAWMARDYFIPQGMPARDLGQRRVRVFLPKLTATPGNTLVFGPNHRDCPGIVISDSTNVVLDGVSVFHCGGMAVIAQRSRDLRLDQVQVVAAPGSGRVVSATADATHFVNCAGSLVMEHCRFENQLDDASNIHGIYAQITRRLGPHEMEVRLKHPQQFSFDFITPGQRLELVDAPSLITYGYVTVKSTDRRNKEFTRVTVTAPLSDAVKPGDVVATADEFPAVVVRHCEIGKNRARGFLLGSRGKMVIENNHFHTPGAALLFEGDGRFWFEQEGVRDLLIRSNVFDNCNFGVWGNAPIAMDVDIEPSRRAESRYNRNIVIEDNLFRIFRDGPIVSVYSVDGLTIRRNRYEHTTDYPEQGPTAKRIDIADSDHVSTDEN
jgi:hypothetical protein